ncbi:MAG: ACP S-malonyltransferase [Planctomycetia bacterium]|nr:ACP S-malonyltransferase [Planctomycetia bacterium]
MDQPLTVALEPVAEIALRDRIGDCAVAYRGYNVTNHGRSAELLAHPAYAAVVTRLLNEAGEVCSQSLGRPVDLVEYVRRQEKCTLDTFSQDVAMILAIEVAHVRLLEQFHGVSVPQAAVAFGYSLGEVSALVCGGVVGMCDALKVLLAMAPDCAELGRDATMGIVFCRTAELDIGAVDRLCQEINQAGQGIIGVSAQLAPNTVLVLGQRDTVDRLKARLAEAIPEAHLRKNPDRWPPLHTPLLWERSIPDRAALMMRTVPAKFVAPQPPVFSLITGRADYNDHNFRDMIHRWIDHPQLLWDAVQYTLASGIGTVLHVGPEPNLIPATFKRVGDNVRALVGNRWYSNLGLRALATVVRPWVVRRISSKSSLLRAPFVQHVNVEDWLLERAVE